MHNMNKTFPVGVLIAPKAGNTISPRTPCPIEVEKAEQYFDKLFYDVAQHHLNIVVEFCSPSEHYEIILKAAEKYKIKVILTIDCILKMIRNFSGDRKEIEVELKQIVEKFKSYSSMLGYFLIDEPNEEIIPNLAVVDSLLKRLDPDRLRFSCLDNMDTMERILLKYHPEDLMIDVYPLTHNTPIGDFSRGQGERQDYSFTQYIDKAQSYMPNRPMWIILQAFGHALGPDKGRFQLWRDPIPLEIRVMTYLAIAHGVKGIIYFLYETLDSTPHEYIKGLRDENNKETPNFIEIGKIADELKILSPVLTISRRVENIVNRSYEFLDIQTFEDEQKNKILIVVNKNIAQTVNAKLKIPKHRIEQVKYITDLYSGNKEPFNNCHGELELAMSLLPGDSKFLRFT